MDNTTPPPGQITLFGTSWCGGSRNSRRILDKEGMPYIFIDIDKDKEAEAFVKQVNRGYRSVPTIVFQDGSMLVEPTRSQLLQKLAEVSRP